MSKTFLITMLALIAAVSAEPYLPAPFSSWFPYAGAPVAYAPAAYAPAAYAPAAYAPAYTPSAYTAAVAGPVAAAPLTGPVAPVAPVPAYTYPEAAAYRSLYGVSNFAPAVSSAYTAITSPYAAYSPYDNFLNYLK